jgi:RNA polymerase sigma factor (TIGR02999 family)
MSHEAEGPASVDVTHWLQEWSGGDRLALERLTPLVYDELRRIGARHLRGERPNHTLQPTELAHEAFLRLVRQKVSWQNRAHFFGVAAEIMRRMLVDHARRKFAEKRGAGVETISLTIAGDWPASQEVDLIGLEDCLTALATVDPTQSRIVELRFFGGLTIEETAEVMGVSGTTIKREWRLARAWLLREMQARA